MSQENTELWAKARRARDKLADQFLGHPDVTLIGIGYAPTGNADAGEIVLRIHVREGWMKVRPDKRPAFPRQVDGIPVIVMAGDYRIENGEPETDG